MLRSMKANKTFIQKEVTAWIARQVQLNATGFVGYTYNAQMNETQDIM